MKKNILIVFLSIFQIGLGQIEKNNSIVEAEMKSASKKMNFKTNPNTQNYDVTYHKLEFTVDPSVYFITGKVTTTFKALSDMTTVTFDLTNQLKVSSVKKDNVNVIFTQNSNSELVITLPATLTTGNTATVEINYSGAPSTSEQAFTATTHGSTPIPVIYTLSEPYGARDWWPCKQDLNDKVDSIDVYITAPNTYVSVSNGVKKSVTPSGSNNITYFQHNYPIAAYLIAIAVTNYTTKNTGTAGLGTAQNPYFPIIDYIYPENDTTTTTTNLAKSIPIINFYESILGPYAFNTEKYGHAQFGWAGGMEHTTVSFMGSFDRELISHEMGHQWFGNKVTCGSWKDIWLNEGITEYMSGCTIEKFDGSDAFISWKTNKINSVISTTDGNLYLTDTQITDVNRIFSSQITYNKGCMVTNMLRFKMGDTNFFQALRNYLNDPLLSYKYAVTTQFQAHLEAVYGSSLQEFFNDWVYNQGYPTYNIQVNNTAVGQATVKINQTQSDPSVTYFEMPVPVRLKGALGETKDVVLENTFNGQTFNVTVPFTVTSVEFDPNKNIISKNNTALLKTENFDIVDAQLFPNPSSTSLELRIPPNVTLNKITFYNKLGQIIIETNHNIVDVSSLSTGIYTVNIESNSGTLIKKFIKN